MQDVGQQLLAEEEDTLKSQRREIHKCEASRSIWTKARTIALPKPQRHEVVRNITKHK